MSSRTHDFRTGLFVLVGAALFVGALFAMGLKAYFGEHEVFETFVTGKVENLSVGALVKLRGVTIGKVHAIEFVRAEYPAYGEQYVLIRFEVPKGAVWGPQADHLQQTLDAEAAHGLRARVQSEGFLGASIVALEYVNPTLYPIAPLPFTPKHYFIPSAPSQFNRLLSSLELSLYHAENIDFAAFLDRAKALIEAANRVADHVDQVDFKQLGTNANTLISEFRESNRGLQRTLADAQDAIKGADLPELSRQTAALEAKLASAALQLRHLLASVDTGELNASLANVRAATDELVGLIDKLQRRPSSVLFSRGPKPTPELETPPK